MMKLCIGGDIVNSNTNNTILFSKNLVRYIENSDLFIFNLEGPIISEKLKKISVEKKGPRIFQSEDIISSIPNKNKLFCLANNHIMDYGIEGLKITIDKIKKSGNKYTGAGINEDVYLPYLIEKEKIAIFNVCESGFGMEDDDNIGYPKIMSTKLFYNIQNYKKRGYLVFVFPHAGAENIKYPLPEIRKLYKYYIDIGADLVIGNHPHVIQGKECYKGKYIYYSLGNMYFNDLENDINLYNPCNLMIFLEVEDSNIRIKEIFLNKKNNLIDIDDNSEQKENFDSISNFLDYNDQYLEYINTFCYNIYNKVYTNYINYESSLSFVNLKCKVKSILKIIFNKTNIDDGWIIHNYINETNRWIIKRAIKGEK